MLPMQVVELGYDYYDDDPDPFPGTIRDSHGTSVTGEVAMAKDNDVCGVGVAYQSSVTGNLHCHSDYGLLLMSHTCILLLLSAFMSPGIRLTVDFMTDMQEASALSHLSDTIQIYSNSWGPDDIGNVTDGPGMLLQVVFETGIMEVSAFTVAN